MHIEQREDRRDSVEHERNLVHVQHALYAATASCESRSLPSSVPYYRVLEFDHDVRGWNEGLVDELVLKLC